MIGNGYWSTGIVVRYGYSGMDRYGWCAHMDFCDDGFAGDDHAGRVSTEGRLTTRYYVRDSDGADGLTAAIDALKADAERLGIRWGVAGGTPPCLYYEGDGESEDYPPPDGWRELINAQAERLGWHDLYAGSQS